MATSINYSSTSQTGKNLAKSITDINPDISNGQIKEFVQKINALTTNTLGTINRVDKSEIDTGATYVDLTPELNVLEDTQSAVTISGTTITVSDAKLKSTFDITEMVDVVLTLKLYNTATQTSVNVQPSDFNVSTTNNPAYIWINRSAAVTGATLDLYLAKSENGERGTTTITIPAGKFNPGSGTVYYNTVTITINVID